MFIIECIDNKSTLADIFFVFFISLCLFNIFKVFVLIIYYSSLCGSKDFVYTTSTSPEVTVLLLVVTIVGHNGS